MSEREDSGSWVSQILAVMRLELSKSFFSRRGLWIYLLAFGPAALYLIHAIDVTRDHERHLALAAAHPVSTMALHLVHEGTTEKELQDLLGELYFKNEFNGNGRRRGGSSFATYRYTDGESDFGFLVVDGEVRNINEQDRCNLTKD